VRPLARAPERARPALGRSAAPLLLSLTALVLTVVVAAGVGSVPIPAGDVVGAVARGVGRTLGSGATVDASTRIADAIVWQIRLPRVVLAAVVGAALAVAGAAFQGVFRNPLADPYLLGTASGAGLAAAVVMAFGASWPLPRGVAVPSAAFAGALATVVVVVALARRGWSVPVVPLILAGVVVGSMLSAATSFVLLASREQAAGILGWLLGSLSFASWDRLAVSAPTVLVALVVLLACARGLDVLQLGETSAAQLGVPVDALKVAVVAAATLATAAAVSMAGIIGFVGLVVPHAVRLALGPDHGRLLPLAAVWGAMFLVAADLVARTVIAPAELPVGIVTSLVGAPFFLILLRRRTGAT
jgi:iron complex transport system permease protein